MTKELKPARIATAMIAAPALMALAACDVPAEDPAGDELGTTEEMPMEEPVETAPLDDTAPADSGLEGGGMSTDDTMSEPAVPPAPGEATGDDASATETPDEPAAAEDDGTTSE